MYSRDFGGIRSDGQLYNLQQELNQRTEEPPACAQPEERHEEHFPEKREKSKGFGLDFLRDLKIDDLILIGIGLLILLDGEEENDIFVLIIALLLMF